MIFGNISVPELRTNNEYNITEIKEIKPKIKKIFVEVHVDQSLDLTIRQDIIETEKNTEKSLFSLETESN